MIKINAAFSQKYTDRIGIIIATRTIDLDTFNRGCVKAAPSKNSKKHPTLTQKWLQTAQLGFYRFARAQ